MKKGVIFFELLCKRFHKLTALILCVAMLLEILVPASFVFADGNRYIRTQPTSDGEKVLFTVKADGAQHGYVLGKFNGWNFDGAKASDSALEKFKVARESSDQGMTGEMRVEIPYSDLESQEQKREYKVLLFYPNWGEHGNWIWIRDDGSEGGNNSLFPEKPQNPPSTPQNPPGVTPPVAAGTKVETVATADGVGVEFSIKADGFAFGYIVTEANGWKFNEDYKFIRDAQDVDKTQTIVKTLDYSLFHVEQGKGDQNKKSDYKVVLFKEGEAPSESVKGIWINAQGEYSDTASSSQIPQRPDRYPEPGSNIVTELIDEQSDSTKVRFTVKADGYDFGYVMTYSNQWKEEEAYQFSRKTGASDAEMVLELDYNTLTQNNPNREYKVKLYKKNERVHAVNGVWMNAQGERDGNNSNFPEKTQATPPQTQDVQNYVLTKYLKDSDSVEFTVKADGYDYGYVAFEASGWGDVAAYKFVRESTDVQKTGLMSITIPYHKLESKEKYAQYKVKLYKEGDTHVTWMRHDGDTHRAENSRFPYRSEVPRDLVFYNAIMDEQNTVKLFTSGSFIDSFKEFELFIDGEKKEGFTTSKRSISHFNQTIETIDIDINSLWTRDFAYKPNRQIIIKRKGSDTATRVTMRDVLDAYVYMGDDMGAVFTDSDISLKLWAPTATKVETLVYDQYEYANFEGQRENPSSIHVMQWDESTGIWSVTLDRARQEGKFYLYRLTFGGENNPDKKMTYAVDPYAKAVGQNGIIAAFVDISKEDVKPMGFDAHSAPELANPEDSILYEMHIRDFTIKNTWGGDPQKAGKYLGVVQEGTKYTSSAQGGTQVEVSTGLDHLKELGVTHVHILPSYDFVSTDESKPAPHDSTSAHEKATVRNWGYDPQNYNVPEGSYSSDSSDPKARIKEYREMVQGLHQAGIRVVNDVVYNHMASTQNMDNIVLGYYFRSWENGDYSNDAGCGNAVETRRPMVRKFIVDSCVHWVQNYKVDGLRFDLMAILDKSTMTEIKEKVRKINPSILIYGEPWMADSSPLPGDQRTEKNAGLGFFNDSYRNALRGDNSPSKGYVTNMHINQGAVQHGLRAGDTNGAFDDPEYMINYVEAHDNYAIYDQIEKSENPGLQEGSYRQNIAENALSDWRVKKAILANAFVFLSQGIPFYQGGSEILRTKQGDHNSYKSNDAVNDFDWEDKVEFQEVFDYYKGLIELRKTQSLFRLTTREEINAHVEIGGLNHSDELIYQYLKNNPNPKEWKNILVIYNVGNDVKNIKWLPGSSTTWKVVVDHTGVDLKNPKQEIVQNGNSVDFTIAANSLMVLYNNGDEQQGKANISWDYLFADQSIDYMSPMEPSEQDEVTLRFRAKAGEVTEAKLHLYHADLKSTDVLEMKKVGDSFYTDKGYDRNVVEFFEIKVPASAQNRHYYFEIINKRSDSDVKTVWLNGGKGENGRGISNAKPNFHGFAIVPGYKTPQWSKESILYQIMVDRFRDGDTKNNKVPYDFAKNGDAPEISAWNSPIYNGKESDMIWNNQFFGGDLTGVQEALPYLKEVLGVNGLYLMPIFQSDSDHKYDVDTYEYIDKNFGGNMSLARLGNELKSQNMRYIMDGVFNHSASNGSLFQEKRDLFFKGSWRDEKGVEFDHFPWHQKYFNFAKLDYSKDKTKDYIYKGQDAVAKRYLSAPYYSSGWRLDAAEDVSEIPRDFKVNEQKDPAQFASNLKIWKEFEHALSAQHPQTYILGEYWGNENDWYYNKSWDGKMNYGGFLLPFIENRAQNEWLGSQSLDNKHSNTGKDMSVADIAKFTREYIKDFPYPSILNSTNSISTHDKPRFLNSEYAGAGNDAMMQLAQTLQMTHLGIPMIYYADEIGTIGEKDGVDPYNRSTFNWNDDEWDYEMLNNYRQLIHTRKHHLDAFVYGAFEEVTSSHAGKYLVYARYGSGDKALVVLNNNGVADQNIKIADVQRYGFKEGEILVDVLSGEELKVKNGSLAMNSKKMSAAVYVVQTPTARVEPLDHATFDVEAKLTDLSDTRIVLNQPNEVVYEKNAQNHTIVTFKLQDQSGLKGAVVKVFEKKSDGKLVLLKETELDKGVKQADLGELSGEFEIVVKALANRDEKASGSVGDAYGDSEYVKAQKKADSQGGGPQNGGNQGQDSTNQSSAPSKDDSAKKSDPSSTKSMISESRVEAEIANAIKKMPQGSSLTIKLDKDQTIQGQKAQDQKNQNQNTFQVPLSHQALKKLSDHGVKTLVLSTSKVEVSVNNKSLEKLSLDSNSNVELFIGFDKATQAITSKAKEQSTSVLSDVFEISLLKSKAKETKEESVKTLKLAIPYALKEGQKKEQIRAYSVDKNGEIKQISASVYDEKNQKMHVLVNNGSKVFLAQNLNQKDEFVDIQTHYAKQSMDFIADRGVMNGVSEREFHADANMNRAMLVTVLGRLSGSDLSGYTSSSFKDVSSGKYYFNYVQWAYQNKIVNGVSADEYKPYADITREDAALMIMNFVDVYGLYLENANSESKVEFKDEENISAYARDAVAKLSVLGIIQGRDGRFDPKAKITRAEISIILTRLIQKQVQF